MVLERLVSIRTAVREPGWMLLIGGMISVICLFISFLIFETSVGLFTTFLVTFAMTPFMLNLVTREEEIDEDKKQIEKLNILQRHKDILKVYTAFFAGMILSLSIVYLVLPDHIAERLFEDQLKEIESIRGGFLFFDDFQKILMNNIGVLFLSFLFSFLFGAGAVFILAWNASVLAAAIGMAAKSIGGLKGFPLAILMFFPHGSLE
ncbi:MAG: stage II sporulation protein M, partial [Candidatus Micrarchaeia archaeon]